MERTWLLEELKPWETARKALGLILDRPLENPLEPGAYRWFYRKKVLQILERALKHREPYLEDVDTYLYRKSSLEIMLPSKPEAQDILDSLMAFGEWQGPYLALNAYLQNRGSLQRVKESLGLEDEYRSPVSDKEFLKDLKELSFGEFLELVT